MKLNSESIFIPENTEFQYELNLRALSKWNSLTKDSRNSKFLATYSINIGCNILLMEDVLLFSIASQIFARSLYDISIFIPMFLGLNFINSHDSIICRQIHHFIADVTCSCIVLS